MMRLMMFVECDSHLLSRTGWKAKGFGRTFGEGEIELRQVFEAPEALAKLIETQTCVIRKPKS
ncbi:hypothetical protein AB6A23_24800 [Paenibacillus tarimensis]